LLTATTGVTSGSPTSSFPSFAPSGGEVVTGEDAQGEQITPEVRRRIEDCDALIAFRTRRGQPDGSGLYRTHRWVEDELVYAIAHGLRVLEVREKGVDPQAGMPGDRQYVEYDRKARGKCLVDLARTVGNWSRGVPVNLKLVPQKIYKEILPHLTPPNYECTYVVWHQGRESPEQEAKIRPVSGGLFVNASRLPPQALIQIHVKVGDKRWSSEFSPIDSVDIRLKRAS